jgi:hypothetical protein
MSALVNLRSKFLTGFLPKFLLWARIKVKFTLEQTMKANRGSKCVALLFI